MNNKGQTIGVAIIVAIMFFMVGMMVLNFLMPEVTRARSITNLNCSDSTISDGSKLTCLMVDTIIPYFMLLVLSVAIGKVTERVLM